MLYATCYMLYHIYLFIFSIYCWFFFLLCFVYSIQANAQRMKYKCKEVLLMLLYWLWVFVHISNVINVDQIAILAHFNHSNKWKEKKKKLQLTFYCLFFQLIYTVIGTKNYISFTCLMCFFFLGFTAMILDQKW